MMKTKKYIALLLVVTILINILPGCSNKSSVDSDKVYLTRAGWIKQLCETMNLDSYNQEIPYYSDIASDEEIFPYVQAAYEWGIISDSKEFKPNDIATFGFMATTAVLASEGDYKQFDVGDESDAIIAYAKMSHLISTNLADNQLNDGITIDDAENALLVMQHIYLSQDRESVENIQLDDSVVDIRDKKSDVISIDEDEYLISQEYADKLSEGSVFISPGDNENPSGIAKKVKYKEDNGDGTYRILTSQPEISEVYKEIQYYGTVVPSIEDVVTSDGVELVCDNGESNVYTSNIIEHNNTSFISTSNTAENKLISDKDVISKFEFNVNFTNGKVSVGDGFNKIESDYFTPLVSKNTGIDKEELGQFFKKTGYIPSKQMRQAEKDLEDNMNLYREGEITLGELQQRCNLNNSGTEKIFAENQYSGGYEITGKITLEDFYITPDICFKKMLGVPYDIESFSIGVGNSITNELSIKGTLKDELTIAQFNIPFGETGIEVKIKLKLVADINGNITAKLEVQNEEKLSYKDGKFKATNTKTSSVSGNINVKLTAGAKIEVVLEFFKMGVADFSIDCKFVAKASGELKETTTFEKDEKDNTVTVTKEGVVIPKVEMFFPVIDIKVGYDDHTLMAKLKITKELHFVKEGEGWSKIFIGEDDKKTVYKFSESAPIKEDDGNNETLVENTENTEGSKFFDVSDYYIALKKGESKTITVDVMPEGYNNSDLKWSSSDESVATVNNGKINSVSAGTCIISVSINDGEYVQNCTVTVTDE